MLDRLAAVGEPNLVCSLHEIDDGGPILVAMQSDVTTWFDGKDAHSKFPAGHAFDLGGQIDHRSLAGREALVAFRGVFRVDDGVRPPTQENRRDEQHIRNLAVLHNRLPLYT